MEEGEQAGRMKEGHVMCVYSVVKCHLHRDGC